MNILIALLLSVGAAMIVYMAFHHYGLVRSTPTPKTSGLPVDTSLRPSPIRNPKPKIKSPPPDESVAKNPAPDEKHPAVDNMLKLTAKNHESDEAKTKESLPSHDEEKTKAFLPAVPASPIRVMPRSDELLKKPQAGESVVTETMREDADETAPHPAAEEISLFTDDEISPLVQKGAATSPKTSHTGTTESSHIGAMPDTESADLRIEPDNVAKPLRQFPGDPEGAMSNRPQELGSVMAEPVLDDKTRSVSAEPVLTDKTLPVKVVPVLSDKTRPSKAELGSSASAVKDTESQEDTKGPTIASETAALGIEAMARLAALKKKKQEKARMHNAKNNQ